MNEKAAFVLTCAVAVTVGLVVGILIGEKEYLSAAFAVIFGVLMLIGVIDNAC